MKTLIYMYVFLWECNSEKGFEIMTDSSSCLSFSMVGIVTLIPVQPLQTIPKPKPTENAKLKVSKLKDTRCKIYVSQKTCYSSELKTTYIKDNYSVLILLLIHEIGVNSIPSTFSMSAAKKKSLMAQKRTPSQEPFE